MRAFLRSLLPIAPNEFVPHFEILFLLIGNVHKLVQMLKKTKRKELSSASLLFFFRSSSLPLCSASLLFLSILFSSLLPFVFSPFLPRALLAVATTRPSQTPKLGSHETVSDQIHSAAPRRHMRYLFWLFLYLSSATMCVDLPSMSLSLLQSVSLLSLSRFLSVSLCLWVSLYAYM